jgi:hypothetical protein
MFRKVNTARKSKKPENPLFSRVSGFEFSAIFVEYYSHSLMSPKGESIAA